MNRYINLILNYLKKAAKKFNQVKGKLSWSLLGNIIFALSQWGIVTVLARMGIGTDLGDYSLALALAAPIIIFFEFNLRALLVTDSKNEYDFNEYLGSRILHMLLAYVILIVFVILYTDDKTIIIITLLIGILKFIESLSGIVLGYFQKHGQIDLIGKSQLYRGIYSVLFFTISYYITKNLTISVVVLVIIMLMRLLLYDLSNLKKIKSIGKIKPVINDSSLRLIKLAYPLGFTALMGSLLINLPRYFLDYFTGVMTLGVFSALYYILVASDMLIKPITMLAGPQLANSYNNNKNLFFKKMFEFIGLSIVVFLVIFIPVLFYAENILYIFYGKNYVEYYLEFKILTLSMLFSFMNGFLNIGIISMRVLKSQAIINLILLVITIITSMMLIPIYGILGASIVIVISRMFQTILLGSMIVFTIKKIRINPNREACIQNEKN